jgi:hypothetical protein
MLLFPLYAICIWYCCARWRRSLGGFAALIFGEVFVLTFMFLLKRVLVWSGGSPAVLDNFSLLLWGELAIVGLVGGVLVALPTTRAQHPCRKCGYELVGLEEHPPRCPECGLIAKAR